MAEWTDGEIARLRHLWLAGLSTSDIGRAMNKSKNSIVGKAHRVGLPGRDNPKGQQKYAYDKAKLIEMRKLGMTPKEIGLRFGLPRHLVQSVIGKVSDLLPPVPRGRTTYDLPTELPPLQSVKKITLADVPDLVIAPPVVEAPVVLKLTSIKTVPVAVGRACLWPTWSAKDAAYWAAIRRGEVLECGSTRASASDSYCVIHKRASAGRSAA